MPAEADDPPTMLSQLMTALAEFVGKPVRAHLVNDEGINTTINGLFLLVEESDDPWAPDALRLVIAHDDDSSAIVIDGEDVAAVHWVSPLRLVLKVDFGDGELHLVDRSPEARMLNTEIRVGQQLAATDPPRWRHSRLSWVRGVIAVERDQVLGADRERLDHLLAFLAPYEDPPAGEPEGLDDLVF